MAERTGRKPTPGRKHRSPRHKMAARIAPYSRGENHRRPGSTTARRSGGVCPVGFETRRGCCRWIRTPTIYVFLDVLRSIEERIVFITHDKLVSSPQAFSTIIEFNIYEDHAFLITNLDKVLNHYECAECQRKSHQSMQPAVVYRGLYEKGNQGVVPRRANPDSRNGV